ncbi:HpcH/HpaI aldolase/citrate lyase family protein [Ignatzschineria larvae DSM 13226]|uniref:HpcH/HpaI aldolase/citrate lyase family protein n=1 Tax=Ignatzschineria larvae DSM 13226 TaxID=1111732 RepID=A0ABZ3BYS3_9GAMM|nr:HpcH/HpaI aldolase/citrate lyase family protein [Ignatzschineria larvae]
MKQQLSPWQLGATLYMPATRQDLLEVILTRKYPQLRSLILCLEDSVSDADLDFAINNLHATLISLAKVKQSGVYLGNSGADEKVNTNVAMITPLVFIRPRNIAIAEQIIAHMPLSGVSGFVLPKYTLSEVDVWWRLLENTSLYLMPTLEERAIYDVTKMEELAVTLRDHPCYSRIIALRIGGNDLMNGLRLRRDRNYTLYEGPMGYLIKMLVSVFASKGFYLTAPVCEHIESDFLIKELELDLLHGLVGKTVIHPTQISVVEEAYRVPRQSYEEAKQILSAQFAVFKVNGSMCEPVTQSQWAADIIERERFFGIKV